MDTEESVKIRIALVSAREALALDEDMPLLVDALRSAGAEVDVCCWDDPAVNWAGYDAAVLRSTWDYVDRIDEFLDWCERCSGHTQLLNPAEVVRWNTDKHYLEHLARAGVAVVPTRFVEPGMDAAREFEAFLGRGPSICTVGGSPDFDEFVVKPAVGAGSRDAARYARHESARALEHLRRLLDARRSVLLQPYLARVDEHGETAVLYLGGKFSHAIRKGPLLHRGAKLVDGLFAPEDIRPRAAEPAEMAAAAAAYAAIPFEPLAYARIDLVLDSNGAPVVLELEVTEPSLFFAHATGAAERFAQHLVERIQSGGAKQ